MRRIYTWDGTAIELTEQQFLLHLFSLSETLHSFSDNFSRGLYGFPDFGINETWDKSGKKNLQNTLLEIDDKELNELFFSWGTYIQKMYNLSNQLIVRIANFFNLPAPQTQEENQEIAMRISEAEDAIWLNEPEYQGIAEQLRQVAETTQEVRNQIDKRLKPLWSNIPEYQEHLKFQESVRIAAQETFEDEDGTDIDLSDDALDKLEAEFINKGEQVNPWQFANDLIDSLEGVFNPKRSIQILHLALRYQSTGIQASKAYMNLDLSQGTIVG
jgi:hypothetical protein